MLRGGEAATMKKQSDRNRERSMLRRFMIAAARAAALYSLAKK
jgi:hypothetical protein